jgi:hypothetical protein
MPTSLPCIGFLVVAEPHFRCPVDPIKSLEEMIRLAKDEVIIMAIVDGHLVGTMGLMRATWWYGAGKFLTDRWHFALPDPRFAAASKAIMDEAKNFAALSGLEFIHQGKIRPARDGVTLMMPRAYNSVPASHPQPIAN